MWVKYSEQDWYLEEKDIYDEELQEVCEKLNCSKEEVFLVNYDDDPKICEKLLNEHSKHKSNLFKVNGCDVYFIYHEGGGVSFFTNKVNIDKI